MTQVRKDGQPWHLWAVGVLSLLWNAVGAFDYTMTKTHNAAYLAQLTAEQRVWIDGFPVWANAAWAFGVWGAVSGSILLLARSRWAVHAFGASLAGAVVTAIFQHAMSGMPASMKTTGGAVFSVVICLVAALLLWYAMRMRARGELR